ncbi:MAG: hypothetical protein EP330_16695 [Deltaproteobacteria bacterium]|nr:MAG: hypothetical protein EP330_16695 [Deltaproteobacteria bacterium]
MRHLLLLLLLGGCGPEAAAPPSVEITLPDAPPGTGEGQRTDFARAFTPRPVVLGEGQVLLSTRVLGEFRLGDESLCAGTPEACEVLPISLIAGQYPVEIAVAGEVVAALRVRIASGTAVRWDFVGSAGSDGHVLLCGEAARDALAGGPGRDIAVRNQAGLDAAYLHEAVEPGDVAVCASGYGEGAYDVFVGFDSEGTAVEVVVDFGVLVRPVEAAHDLGDLLAMGEQALEVPGLTDRGIKVARVHAEDAVLALDFAAVITDPTIGGYELQWYDERGEPLFGRSQGFGSKLTFSAPRGVRAARAELRWVARLEPV